MKEPYVGQCELKTGEIGDDLTYYFAVSEQVPSSVGLGVLMEKDNTVRQAGGFIIQLMPFTSDEVIDRLEAEAGECQSVTSLLDAGHDAGADIRGASRGVRRGDPDTVPTSISATVRGSALRRALISLGKKELEEMIADGETIEVGCQFCNKKYPVTVEELRSLLARSRR